VAIRVNLAHRVFVEQDKYRESAVYFIHNDCSSASFPMTEIVATISAVRWLSHILERDSLTSGARAAGSLHAEDYYDGTLHQWTGD
jgi:hypothetical protein